MKRCQFRGLNLHSSATRDSVQVSDGAAEVSSHALLRKGSNVTCKCKVDPNCSEDDCDEMYATDETGTHFVTFHGKDFRARQMKSGNIAIYRQPQQQQKQQTQDAVPAGCCHDKLEAINEANAQFWARPKGEK
jgi:UDP-N-acetylmuramyl tripeptide synthase